MQWFKIYGAEMLADPKYQRLTAAERSCWITLLCLASMNDGIVQHCEEQYLISHSGVDPASASFAATQGILMRFEMLGMIEIGRDNAGVTFIVIKNWHKRQDNVPMTGYERLKKWRDSKKIQVHDNEMITDDNGKNRQDKNRQDKTDTVREDSGFNQFWKQYPKKVGKTAAFSSWKKVRKPPLEEILAAIEKQTSSEQWRKEDGRFIPNPATWLNQGRWDDEITSIKSKTYVV